MRKIFALSLIACLALSGAAFGATKTYTHTLSANTNWNADNVWADKDNPSTKLTGEYPGGTGHVGDSVELTAALNGTSSWTMTIPAAVTIGDLTVDGNSKGNTGDLKPEANLTVSGKLTVNMTGVKDPVRIFGIANNVDVNVTSLEFKKTTQKVFLATANADDKTATFTLGGIKFSPVGPSPVYTRIEPDAADGITSFKISYTNTSAATPGIADKTDITFAKGTMLAAPTTPTGAPTFVTSEDQTFQLYNKPAGTVVAMSIPAANPIVLNGGSLADSSKTPVLTGKAELTTTSTGDKPYAIYSSSGTVAFGLNTSTVAQTHKLNIKGTATLDGTLTVDPNAATATPAKLEITGGNLTSKNKKNTITIDGTDDGQVTLASNKAASLTVNDNGITIKSADLGGTVAVEGTVTANNLIVDQKGDVTLSGDVTLEGTTNIAGKATLNGTVNFQDTITAGTAGAIKLGGMTAGNLYVFNDASVISLDAAATITSNDATTLTFAGTGAKISKVTEVKAGKKVILDNQAKLYAEDGMIINGTLALADSNVATGNAGTLIALKANDNPEVIVSKDATLVLSDDAALTISNATNSTNIAALTVYGTLEFLNNTGWIADYKTVTLEDGAKIVVSNDTGANVVRLGRDTGTATNVALTHEGSLTITLNNGGGTGNVAYLADSLTVASGDTLTINGTGKIYVSAGTNKTNDISIEEGAKLSIGDNIPATTPTGGGVFPITLAGTLEPTTLPLKLGIGVLDIADTAKLDLDAACLALIKNNSTLAKIKNANGITNAITALNGGSTGTGVIQGGANKITGGETLAAQDVNILLTLAEDNAFGLNAKNTSGDVITYCISMDLTYDSRYGNIYIEDPRTTIVSTDLKVYSGGTTSDTPVTPDPGTGTTAITVDAIAPDNGGTADATTGAYTVKPTTTDNAVTFTLPAKTTDGKTLDYTNAVCTATITRGGIDTTVPCTIKDNKVSITPAATNDEFTVKFTFTKVTTGEVATTADATVTTEATKVIVNGGALTPYITANGTAFSQKTDDEIKISVTKWEHKFTAVTVANESYTVALKGETGTVVPAEKAAYTANAAALKAGTYTYKASAVYTPDGATEAATVADIPVEFTVTDDGGDPGTGGNGGGGGGCSAGVASLALLLAIPMLLKRK